MTILYLLFNNKNWYYSRKVGGKMNKKIFTLTALLLVFGVLFSNFSYAGSSTGSSGSSSSSNGSTNTFTGFDVSIDRVRVNGQVIAESKTNLINDADVFSVLVDFTNLRTLDNAHVEAILRGRQSGDTVSDFTNTFDLAPGLSSTSSLTLVLIDSLKRETEFDLTIKIIDARGNSEQKTYGIKTDSTRTRGAIDVSIDRVKVNDKVVAPSRTNFIDESNDFDVLVEFTALEDLEDAHVEAILRDLKSGTVIADASPNFDLDSDTSSSKLLRLELLDVLKQSDSFELTVKIVDAEGDSIQQVYGLAMRDGNGIASRDLDISIDSVEVESKVVAENENNFVIIGENKKELDVRVRLTSLETVKDAHVDAILTFENGDVVADATATFDIAEGENLIKKLELPLIGIFGQNSFKLKIRVVDAEGDSEEKVYGLKISMQDFPFIISSISLEPENNLQAGKNLVATLSVKNSGVVPLDGIQAKVSIPELGISSTKFIDQIRNSGRLSEIREDFILKIMDDAQTGTYTVKSEVMSQFGGESEIKEIPIFILGKSEQPKQIINDKLVVNVPLVKQNMLNDGSEVIYQLTLTNEGPDANTYTILLDGSNWANLRLVESNTFVLKSKGSKTVNIYASTTTKSLGEQAFLVTIKDDDEVLTNVVLKANVVAVKGLLAIKLKNILEIVLIGVVIVLVAIGIFFGLKGIVEGGNSTDYSEEILDQELGEPYY